ncbi:YdcF family protein [Candidatus Peregrinibacteria bacterium]|nr:YdcF family protein [Candidatus Peregrinibacteria bacterium]
MRVGIKKILIVGLSVFAAAAVFCSGVVFYVQNYAAEFIYFYSDIENIPIKDVAIVFGASVNPDTLRPSDMLTDRLITGVELYRAGKVQKIVMSGDNRVSHYNEPLVMKKFAEDLGVPTEDIVLDYAGRRTYDTCYRAVEIFGIKNAVLVTQKYHLYRALYTCRSLGVDAVGVDAARQAYIGQNYYDFREFFATLSTFFDVNVLHPRPILGEKIDINLPY